MSGTLHGTGLPDQISEGYDALRRSVAVHQLERDVLAVSGPDAASYLQGQCSQDVSALGDGGSAEALLLSPQGKIDAYLRLTKVAEDSFILDTDQGFGPVVTARLERFRLRMKVVIEPVQWICVALRGPDALRAATALTGRPQLVVAVDWPGLAGVDLLGPAPAGGVSGWVGDGVVRCGDVAWEAARIEAGVPVNGREIVDGSIAAELGLVDRTVSFTKGCFTGQELVARLDARGSNVAKRLCGVVVGERPDAAESGGAHASASGLASVPVGAAVLTSDGSTEAGHLSSVAWSPGAGATVALATVHRRVTPPEPVVVTWDDGAGTHQLPAESRLLPMTASPADPAG
jgi:tRNA-modifying protein YgfZ